MRTSRLEAFSDGVFAIAITLLVLDLRVNEAHRHDLRQALWFDLWPSYAAYVVSFFVIGVIWVNHHTVLDTLVRVDKTLIVLNMCLLFTVVTIPFTTSLFAEYLQEGDRAKIAAAIYSGLMLLHGVLWTTFWAYAVNHSHLLGPGIDRVKAKSSVRSFSLGVPAYSVAVLLSFVNAYVVLALHLVLALVYLRGRIDLGDRVDASTAPSVE
ncbi:MAG: TMEM175 family protein [Actinomycetota bacterium]